MPGYKKLFLILFVGSFILPSGCQLILILPPGIVENVEDFKVEPGTKPSELIQTFIDSTVNNTYQNYVVVTYDHGCGGGAAYTQIIFTNKLYKETHPYFQWIAVTTDDVSIENKVRKHMEYTDKFRYKYPTYYNVIGLKSSLRNLYHNNNVPDGNIIPMTFFIASDTIRRITRGAINTEEQYLEHKNFLDSLSQIHR
jgi:hypothetical protein